MEAYPNVMIDLETLGKVPGCAILSVGAVMFDLEKDIVGPMFHQYVSFRDNVLLGLDLDPDTMRWWLGSGMVEAANATIPFSMASRLSVREVLEDLDAFVAAKSGNNKDVRAWSNGGNFDHPILSVARQRAGLGDPYWQFWNEKCYRTLKDWYKEQVGRVEVTPAEIKHHAGHDAEYQARLLIAYTRKFFGLHSRYFLPTEELVSEMPPPQDQNLAVEVAERIMVAEEAALLTPPTALPGGLGAPELALGRTEVRMETGLFIPIGSNPDGKDGTGKTD